MAAFNDHDTERAVEELSMLEFFPREPGTQAAIQRLLAKMCPSKEALRWLVSTMVNRVGKWHGSAELRGVLCWKFMPADGISADCSIAGFTPGDGEARTLEAHEQIKGGGWIPGKQDAPGQLTKAGPIVMRLLKDGSK